MSFIPVPNAVQVSLQFTQNDGEFAENTFGVQYPSEPSTAAMTALAAAFNSWWQNGDGTHTYQALQSTGVYLTGTNVRDLTTQSSPSVEVPLTSGTLTGTDSDTTVLPQGVSFAITARTGLTGRSYRGRTFLLGLTKAFLAGSAGNQAAVAKASAAVSAFNALISQVHGLTGAPNLVVISRYSGVDSHGKPVPRVAGITTPITTYAYHDLFIDYQRRRAPAHNRHH